MSLELQRRITGRRILFAYGEQESGPTWLHDADAALLPLGYVLCKARTGPETIRRIEEGGLAAAVVVEDQRAIDALSLLRIIRSIDNDLPCWLLTHDTRRQTLESALALRVMSVFSREIEVAELVDAMSRRLPGIGGIG